MPSIVDEIRNDREKGAKRLESEYKAGLMALARRFCTDESDAEELVNSTFAAVIENIDRYLEQSAFFGWMSRILVNIHAKGVRRMSSKMEFCCADIPEGEADDESCAKIFREVDAAILRDAIDRLPEDMKRTLMLHYFMGISVGEVAKILLIPSGTVKWRLHYARQILAARLGAGIRKKPVVAIAAAALFLAAGAMVATGVAHMLSNADDAGVAGAAAGDAERDADVETWFHFGESPFLPSGVSGPSGLSVPAISPYQPISLQEGKTTMNMKNTTAAALAMTMLTMPSAVLAYGGDQIAVSLNSIAYTRVLENAGPLAGRWSLSGITAWNGMEQTAFACVSNRLYASDTMALGDARLGAMPAGSYVHQLSVFNQWDGSRTRSYRVQIAQPVGDNDIYARVVAVTVSQEGVNLVDYPDPRDFKDDSTKISASYTAGADIANFPVSGLRFKYQAGYVESEGDAFISLGHCVGPNTRIEVDMQMTAYELNDIPFGSYGENSGATDPLFELYISHGGDGILKYSWRYSKADGAAKTMNCDVADLDRHAIAFDATTTTYSSAKVGSELYTYPFTGSGVAFLGNTSTVPLSIFGHGTRKYACQADDFKNSNAPKMKVYGVNIYESGALVKCFVPCLASGIPGLRDVLNNTFVTGVDVSKVKYGGDILEKDDPHIDLLNTVNTREAGKSHYLELAYPFKPTTRIELDYALLANVTAAPFLFSAYGSSAMEVWTINSHYAYTMAGTQRYTDATGVGEVGLIRTETAYGIRRTVAMDAGTVSFVTAGFTNAVSTGASALTSTSNTKILIGNRSALDRYMPVRIYGLRLYENGIIEKNYVPAVTNGVPCLVNAVDGAVLYPKTDSGNTDTQSVVVRAGGDFVCTDGSDEVYLEFPGTGSGLDTGYRLTPNSRIEADFSLYDTYKLASGSANRYELLNQDSGTYVFLAAAVSSSRSLWWAYCDYPASGPPSSVDSGLAVSNDRRQYVFDSKTGDVIFSCGDDVLFSTKMSGSRSRTDGAANNLKIGRKNACMRLYGLKIWEYVNDVKTPVRDFVPCVTNGAAGLYDLCGSGFYPLSGGEVSGRGRGGAEEFVTVPQPTRIARNGTGTLTCFAPSAQSYEWYEDGELVEGETGGSLTLEWTRGRAKSGCNVHIYSVVPVYSVFGEKVRGASAAATVEYTPLGKMLIIR